MPLLISVVDKQVVKDYEIMKIVCWINKKNIWGFESIKLLR